MNKSNKQSKITINKQKDVNLLQQIEERLKDLEKEKEEFESKYGLNENIIDDPYLNSSNFTDIKVERPVKYEELLVKLPSLKNEHNQNTIKTKNNFKPSDSYKQTLKHEPHIDDMKDDKEFEYSISEINYIKPNIQLVKDNDALNDYLNELDDNIINNFY
jgi:hypothetical protein